MLEKNELRLTIPCYMVDCRYNLRISSFMELSQEIATVGSAYLGFGHDELAPNDMAWVLYRMHIEFHAPVRWREDAVLRSWHRGMFGLCFIRDYEMLVDGDVRISASASWVILDTKTRSIARMDDLPDFIDSAPQCTESVCGDCSFTPPRVNIFRKQELHVLGTHKVSWSDVDFNAHSNNTKYISWILDCLSPQYFSENILCGVDINFNKETRLGDDVVLMTPDVTANPLIVEGVCNGEQVFAAAFHSRTV